MYTPDGEYLFVDYYKTPTNKVPYKVLYNVKDYKISHIEKLKYGGAVRLAKFNPINNNLYFISGRVKQSRSFPNVRVHSITKQGFESVNESASLVYSFRGAITWSPDGELFAVGSTDWGEKGGGDERQFIGIWDAKNLKEIRRIEDIYAAPDAYVIYVRSLAWSPDGKYFVVGPNGSSKQVMKSSVTGEMMEFNNLSIPIQVREADSGRLVRRLTGHRAGYGVMQIVFLTDDIFMTLEDAGDGHVVMWSLSTGEILESFKLPKTLVSPALAWHEASQSLAVSYGRIVQVYEFNPQRFNDG